MVRSYAQIPTQVSFVASIEVSRDGNYALCRTLGKDMEILDLKNGVSLRTFSFPENQPNAALSGNGQVLGIAIRDSGEFCLYSTSNGQLLNTIKVKPPAADLVISNDGSTLITSSADNVVRIWDIATGALLRTLNGNTSYPISLALTRDGQTLITGSGNSLMFWDWQSGTLLKTTPGGYFQKPIFVMPQGDVYNVRYDNSGAHVWDITQNQEVLTAPMYEAEGGTATITPDGLTLIAGGVGDLFVYNMVTGRQAADVGDGNGNIVVGGMGNNSTFITADENSNTPYTLFRIYYCWLPFF